MTISSAKTAAAKPALQTIELQASSKTTQKMVAQPGQAFKIVVDGQVYTGQKKINNRALQLMRKGDALLLIAQDQAEPLLEVSGFYAPALDASADTPEHDPSQAASYGPATETPADLQTLFESGSTTHLAAADLGATPAASTPSWGTLIAQAGGAVGTTTATTSAATAATTAAATTATAATATAAAVGAVSVGAVAAAVAIAAMAISSSDSSDSGDGTSSGGTPTNNAPTGSVTITNSTSSTRGTTALQQGDVLTAANTLVDADGLGPITYTWKAGTTTVSTGASYTLTQADVGKAITLVASYTDGKGTAETQTSTATGNTQPQPVDYEITPVLGPLVNQSTGSGLELTLYKKDGSVLGVMTNTNGKFTYTDPSGYRDVVIAKLVDKDNATNDYADEATGLAKNLGDNVLLMVSNVSTNATSVTFSINPLTTAAANKVGVTASNSSGNATLTVQLGTTTADDIVNTNKAVAKAFGVVDTAGNGVDITTVQPKAVVTTSGTTDTEAVNGTDTASAYGRALAVISQAEQASGTSTSELASQVALALDTTKGALTNTTTTEAATATTAVQSAIVKGIANAQADGQMTQTQSTAVVTAVTALPMVLGVSDTKTGTAADTYLNSAEDTIDLAVSGTFTSGQVLKLLNGATAIDFKVVVNNVETAVTGTTGHTFAASPAGTVVLRVAKTDLSTADAGVILKAQLTSGTTTSHSNNLPVVVDGTAPSISSAATASVNENVSTSTAAYTADATDAAITGQSVGVLYSLKAGTGDAALLAIDAFSGKVTFKASPDYEASPAKTSYTFTVLASDKAGNKTEQAVTLSLNDLNDNAPVFTSGDTGSVGENADISTVLYTAATTDADGTLANHRVVYSLKAATGDVAALNIDSATGAVTLKASADYEAKSSYSFTVVATNTGADSTVKTTEKVITVGVNDLNDNAPVFTSGSTGSVAENAAISTVLYTAATTDADGTLANRGVVYSLKAATGDVAALNIDSATGAVTLKASADFETKSSYTFTVVATNGTQVTEQAVTANVTNVNEAPTVANAIANQTFVVGGAADSFVVPANAFSDVDANTTLTYSATLADGSDLPSWLSFDASSRTFSGNPTANGTTTVKVTASDGSLSVSDEFVITAVTAPVLSTKLGVATQLDVRSKIVLSVDQDVNLNDSGTYTITINNTANTTAGTPDSAIKNGFRSETTDHDQVITITNGVVSGDGTITIDHVNNKIIIDPSFDLDLSNNYTLSVSTGAFKAVASGQASQAFTDVNFSTVTPGVGLAAAVQAEEMSTTSGELQNSLKWFDASNIGSPSGNPSPLDFVAGDYAAALKYLTNDPTIEGDANMLLKNFGASDLVYFDNQNHALSNPQTVMNNNAFSQGVGTPADPFGLVVAGTGDLTSVFVYIEVATGITLPDLSNDMLISTVISNGWSNTGMVIVA